MKYTQITTPCNYVVLHALGFEDVLRKFIISYFSTFPGKGGNKSFVNEETEEPYFTSGLQTLN